jgi:NAD(P)-dependent dehydrogenase (short-subunit alcohol dehydrogenase family)
MGKISVPFYGPYTMTKFAVEALTDAQRLELSGTSSIRVTVMELGNIHKTIKHMCSLLCYPQKNEFLIGLKILRLQFLERTMKD